MKRKKVATLLLTLVFCITYVCPAWGFSFGSSSFSSSSQSWTQSPSASIPANLTAVPNWSNNLPSSIKPTAAVPAIPSLPIPTSSNDKIQKTFAKIAQFMQSQQFKQGLVQYLLLNLNKVSPAELQAIKAYISPELVNQLINSLNTKNKADMEASMTQILAQIEAKAPEFMAQFTPLIADYAADYLAGQLIMSGYPGNKAAIKAKLVPVITAVLNDQITNSIDLIKQKLTAQGISAQYASYLANAISMLKSEAPALAVVVIDLIAKESGVILTPKIKAQLVAILTPIIEKIINGKL